MAQSIRLDYEGVWWYQCPTERSAELLYDALVALYDVTCVSWWHGTRRVK